ncbi:MAG: DinB family protein [Nocardioidaceae bacterium]
MTTCAECGFAYEDLEAATIPGALRALSERYRAAFADANQDALRRRPEPAVWSALEYACHVRDVSLVQRDRVIRALVEDCPTNASMHRDERVRWARYAEESPAGAIDQLAMAADLLATVYDGLSAEQLRRTCRYNYPEPTVRDLAWLGRHTLHEGEHHLRDIQRTRGIVTS